MLFRTAPALLLMSGCSASSPLGVYLITTSQPVITESTEAMEHNFVDAVDPEPQESPWSYMYDFQASDGGILGEIIAGEGDHPYMLLVAGMVLRGTVADSGAIRFLNEWTWEDTSSESHEEGYEITRFEMFDGQFEVTFDPENPTAGFISMTSTESLSYTETDEWDPDEVGRYSGQIPSYNYLYGAEGSSIYNMPGEADCEDADCELSMDRSQTQVLEAVFARTSVAPGSFDGVQGYGYGGEGMGYAR